MRSGSSTSPLQRRIAAVSGTVALIGLGAGCRPTRTLFIESVPPGAVVRLDEQVIGRTPLEHKFQHYGERRLSLYSPGYLTHSERVRLSAPWYASFPIDLLTEVILPLGLDDRVELELIVLEPDDGIEAEPAAAGFVARAGEVRKAAREAAAAARAAAPPKAEQPGASGAAVPETPAAPAGPEPPNAAIPDGSKPTPLPPDSSKR